MACLSPPTPRKLAFPNPVLHTPSAMRPSCPPSSAPFQPKFSANFPALCRCRGGSSDSASPSDNPPHWRWDSALQDVLQSAMRQFDSYMSALRKEAGDQRNGGAARTGLRKEEEKKDDAEEEWDWHRWKKHFSEVDERERLVSILKSQLGQAVYTEDYEDAARLKVALAAAAANDTVGRVMSQLNRAIGEERYKEAAFIRDYAGAGLVGWWAGISEDTGDPYGRIIRITAEHGRYVARSYSPRQFATDASGSPLFEVFLTVNEKGEYKQQAVYLKRGACNDPSLLSSKIPSTADNLNPLDSNEDKGDLLTATAEDSDGDGDGDDGFDLAEGLPGFRNILPDVIPSVKVKVLKVTGPGKIDRDLISKVIEQIMEEEDEERDTELESMQTDEETSGETDQEEDENEIDDAHGLFESEPNEIALKVVVDGLPQKLSGSMSPKDFFRVPAKLEKKGPRLFSFSIEQDVKYENSGKKEKGSVDGRVKRQAQRTIDSVMLDLAKFIGTEKIPLKVLKDISELVNLTLNRAQNREPLRGLTTFSRIEIPTSSDPLNGLYIGAHGLYTSEVIQLRRRYGQWHEGGGTRDSSNIEFYEYVEALKLTGDPYVPAGQVAFRAKVGKKYQLPHKGIIPEELGVVARYKGQGRLAEPGFRNPRWVDGELVILDGKYIKGGPVVGFVYWAPEYHFLVFFNRLRLQE